MAIDEDSTLEDAWSILGDVYMSKKLYDDAIVAYRFAHQNSIDTNCHLLKTGKCYEELNRFEEALYFYNLAISECNCFTEAYVMKVLVLRKKVKI